MKILRIRLKNLNSFKGEHELNLCEEPLQSAGLFAIVGNTGAGKTTLLDAITLALYGQMARYENKKNPNFAMHRGCSDCSAEVEFETRSGKFRATWSQKKKKKSEEYEAAVRFVYDEIGNPIAEQIRTAEAKIEELTGLDYTRFLRCAMLAQGDFDKFLTAEPKDRSELLERVTGTDIYSRLGKLTFQLQKEKKNEVKSLQTQLEGIELLSEKELKEKQDEVNSLSETKQVLDDKRKSELDVYGKISTLKDARDKLSKAEGKIKKIDQKQAERKADFEKLKRHEKCQPLVEVVTKFKAVKENVDQAKDDYRISKESALKASEAQDLSTLVLRVCLEAEIPSLTNKLAGLKESIQENEGVLEACREFPEKERTQSFPGLIERIEKVKTSRNKFSGTVKALSDKVGAFLGEQLAGPDMEDLPDIPSMTTVVQELFAKIDERISSLEKAEANAEKDFQLKDDHLKKTRQLADLTDYMYLLEEGKPCPMCGSSEHPNPKPSDEEGKLERIESARNKSEKALAEARDALYSIKDERDKLYEKANECLEALEGKLKIEETLREALEPYAIPLPTFGKEDSLTNALTKIQGILPLETELYGLKEELDALPMVERNEEELLTDFPKITDAREDYENAKAAVVDAEKAVVLEGYRMDRLKSPFEKAKNKMDEGLAALSFATMKEWEEARLPEEEAEQISKDKVELEEEKSEEKGRLKTASDTIEELEKESIPEGKEAQSLIQSFEGRQNKISEISEKIGRLSKELETHEENSKKWEKEEKELGEMKKELQNWARLNELIGSEKGDKFRNHAQSLTLDILVSWANRHLEGLEPRYRLERDENEPKKLGLLIRDEHEGGVTRLVSSLSGGETFLVSLALALGVSDLARGKTRIDTLFIDEGFGSLDSGCLEKAIGVLQNLIHQNKTVGVISHVELLKERITTQVEVEKLPGGRRKLNLKNGTVG